VIEAKAKLETIPARDRCTLVELQLEIALLLQHKRQLESIADRSGNKAENLDMNSLATNDEANIAHLKKEIDEYDKKINTVKIQEHQWKKKFESENAKILPLQARLRSLGVQLSRYRNSKALLRSAFNRADTNGNGQLSLEETIQVLVSLSPPEFETTPESIRVHFSKVDKNNDNSVDFNEFCTAFDSLFSQSIQ